MYNHAPMMPFAPGNRIYTAFLMRLMYVFPAICPREVENYNKIGYRRMTKTNWIILFAASNNP
jgi:hypothetical protein